MFCYHILYNSRFSFIHHTPVAVEYTEQNNCLLLLVNTVKSHYYKIISPINKPLICDSPTVHNREKSFQL